MSRIISSPRTSCTVRTSAWAVAANSFATTTSVGSGISVPRAFALADQSPRDVEHLSLVQRLADAYAGSRQERVGNATADNQLVDFLEQRLEHGQLGRDLRAAHDRNQRPRRFVRARVSSASSSPTSNGPAQATLANRATPCVLASARCAVPNASITNTSHRSAILRASLLVVLLLALVEADVLAQHRAARRAIHAVEPVLAQRHRFAEQLGQPHGHRLQATSDSSYLPSSGRPRCERMNTFAFWSSA